MSAPYGAEDMELEFLFAHRGFWLALRSLTIPQSNMDDRTETGLACIYPKVVTTFTHLLHADSRARHLLASKCNFRPCIFAESKQSFKTQA